MTDEKDWFEKVKDNVRFADRLGYWPFDKNSNDFTAEMKRLIQEVEKLRSENAESREALKHEVDLNAMNLRQCEKLKAQLSKSQKRVGQLMEQNRQRRRIDKNIRSLHHWHPAPDPTTYEEHVTGKCSCGGKR